MLASTKREAERLLADIIVQRNREELLGAPDGAELPVSEFSQRYFEHLCDSKSAEHADRMQGCIERVIKATGARVVRELRLDVIHDYRRERARDKSCDGKKVANATINKEAGAVKAMLDWAVDEGRLADNPLRNLRPLEYGEQKHRKRELDEEEIRAVLAAARERDAELAARAAAEKSRASKGAKWSARPRKPRIPQYAVWLTLVCTGVRWKTLANLTWSDVLHLDGGGALRLRVTKNRRPQTIPVWPSVVEALQELRVVQHEFLGRLPAPDDHVFLSPTGRPWKELESRNALKYLREELLRRADVQVTTPAGSVGIHSMRHSAGSHYSRHGMDRQATAKMLGHADASTTERYYIRRDVEDLRRELERVPDLGAAQAPDQRPAGGVGQPA